MVHQVLFTNYGGGHNLTATFKLLCMSSFIPDYGSFSESKLLELRNQIGSLTDEASERLLHELQDRGLINPSSRQIVSLPKEITQQFYLKMKEVLQVSVKEIALVKEGKITEAHFDRVKIKSKGFINLSNFILIFFALVMLGILLMINTKIPLLEFSKSGSLFGSFLFILLVLLPIGIAAYGFMKKWKMSRLKSSEIIVEKHVGKITLSKNRVRGTLSYIYSLHIKNRSFEIGRDLFENLNVPYRMAAYIIKQTGDLVFIEIEDSGKFEVMEL